AFSKNSHFCAELVAGRVVILGLAFFVDAFVFGEYTRDSLALVNQIFPCKLREQIHARFFNEAAEPFDQLVQGDDVVAVISQRWRSDGHFPRARSSEDKRG